MADFDLNSAVSFLADVNAAVSSGRAAVAFTPAQLRDNYEAYKQILPEGGLPVDGGLISPQGAMKYGATLLQNYSDQYKLNLPSGLIQYVAGANGGRGVDFSLAGVRDLSTVLAQGCTTAITDVATEFAASAGLGSDTLIQGAVGIGVTTIDMLSDGSISESEGKALLQTAGSLAGSILGTALSATAVGGPIGAAVGIVAGALMAALVPAPPPPPKIPDSILRTQKDLAIRDAFFQDLVRARSGVVAACQDQEKEYWKAVDEFLVSFAQDWAAAERRLGHKFLLRWYEEAYGPAFYLPATGMRRAGARWALSYMTNPVVTSKTANYWTYLKGNQPVTRCMLPALGCPYPDLQSAAGLPQPSSSVFPGKDMYSSGQREAYALSSRGVVWVPHAQRLDCERFVPWPDARYQSAATAGMYRSILQNKQDEMLVRGLQFKEAATLLQTDLLRTQATMAAQMQLLTDSAKIRTFGLRLKNVGEQLGEATSKKNLLNNAALVGGAGVLGLALWRVLR